MDDGQNAGTMSSRGPPLPTVLAMNPGDRCAVCGATQCAPPMNFVAPDPPLKYAPTCTNPKYCGLAHHYSLGVAVSWAEAFDEASSLPGTWKYAECEAVIIAQNLVDLGVGFWPQDPSFATRLAPSHDSRPDVINAYTRATGSEEPGISVYKLCTPLSPHLSRNRTWQITPSECRGALHLWELRGRPQLDNDLLRRVHLLALVDQAVRANRSMDVFGGPTDAASFPEHARA